MVNIEAGPKFSAYFHQWADQPVEDKMKGGFANCTMALVEGTDGAMHLIHPSCIQFTDRRPNLISNGAKIMIKVDIPTIDLPANDLLKLIKDTTDKIGLDVQFANSLEHLLNRGKLYVDTCYVMRLHNFADILRDEAGKFSRLRVILEDNPGVTIILLVPNIPYISPRLQEIIDRTIQIKL